jgi:hypothetical protein
MPLVVGFIFSGMTAASSARIEKSSSGFRRRSWRQ